MDKDIRTTVREVQRELDELWEPARARGDSGPPPSRVTFSHIGWMEVLSDKAIRGIYFVSDMQSGLATFLGAEVALDKRQTERFKVELREDGRSG